MMADRLINWKRYFSAKPWRQSFEFLESLTPAAEDSNFIPIQGEDIFARIMTYPTRPAEEGLIEAHNVYIDIQMSLSGSESIDVFARSGLDISVPYDAEKEFLLFHPNRPPLATVRNEPGIFTVLFADDAHRAQMLVSGQPETVKKVVIKLRASLLDEVE